MNLGSIPIERSVSRVKVSGRSSSRAGSRIWMARHLLVKIRADWQVRTACCSKPRAIPATRGAHLIDRLDVFRAIDLNLGKHDRAAQISIGRVGYVRILTTHSVERANLVTGQAVD